MSLNRKKRGGVNLHLLVFDCLSWLLLHSALRITHTWHSRHPRLIHPLIIDTAWVNQDWRRRSTAPQSDLLGPILLFLIDDGLWIVHDRLNFLLILRLEFLIWHANLSRHVRHKADWFAVFQDHQRVLFIQKYFVLLRILLLFLFILGSLLQKVRGSPLLCSMFLYFVVGLFALINCETCKVDGWLVHAHLIIWLGWLVPRHWRESFLHAKLPLNLHECLWNFDILFKVFLGFFLFLFIRFGLLRLLRRRSHRVVTLFATELHYIGTFGWFWPRIWFKLPRFDWLFLDFVSNFFENLVSLEILLLRHFTAFEVIDDVPIFAV